MQIKNIFVNDLALPAGSGCLILLEKLAQLLLICLVVSLGGYLLWGLSRGLELTDEAYYVLNGMHPSSVRFFFTPTHWISGPLWNVSASLVAFRATGFAILTVSALTLAVGAIHAASLTGLPVPGRGAGKWTIVAAGVAAAWLYGSILNFSPSYNLLCAAGTYLSVGFYLLSLDCTDRRKAVLIAAAIGVTLGLTVLSKFSTGICITGMLLALHLLFGRYRGVRMVNAIVMMLVLSATLALSILLQSTFHAAWEAFRTGLEVTSLAQNNEPVSSRLLRNWHECYLMLRTVKDNFAWPLLCAGAAALLGRPLIGVVAVVWFGWLLYPGGSLLGGMDHYPLQSQPLLGALCLALLLTLSVWGRRWHALVLVALLSALPFLIALGTGNPLPFQIVLSLASWGVLGGVLVFWAWSFGARLSALLACLVFVAIVASQTITSGFRAPYRLAHPLAAQVVPVDLGVLGWLQVDNETRQLIDDVRAAGRQCRIVPGTPFLGFYNLPGLALILDAVPVDTPWLFGFPFAQAVLSHATPRTVRSAVVALKLDGNGRRPELPSQIGAFPDGYEFCGSAKLPFQGARIELWAPNGN